MIVCIFDTCIQPGHICKRLIRGLRLYPSRKAISTNLLKFQIRYLYLARAHLWAIDCRSIPVSSQESICMKSLKINTCNRPGNYLSFSGTRVLAKESLTRSTPLDGIFKPISTTIHHNLQVASISPSSHPSSLQMASVSPFPTSHCWYSTMRVQISGHFSVQSAIKTMLPSNGVTKISTINYLP